MEKIKVVEKEPKLFSCYDCELDRRAPCVFNHKISEVLLSPNQDLEETYGLILNCPTRDGHGLALVRVNFLHPIVIGEV